MQIIKKTGYTMLLPEPGKVLVQTGSAGPGSTKIILAKSASPEDYEEIDELLEDVPVPLPEPPTEEEEIDLTPDADGKVPLEEVMKLKYKVDRLSVEVAALKAATATE